MSLFQVKYFNNDDWKEISENNVLGKLVDEFGRVSMILSQMIQGKEINTANGIFRMKNLKKTGKIYRTDFNNYQ